MDEALKLNMHSNRTTAASIAVVSFVTYVALVSLQSILMPLAIAILLYFLIKPLERLIFKKLKKVSILRLSSTFSDSDNLLHFDISLQ